METKTRVIIISPNQALVQSLEQFFHQTFDRYGIELVLCRDSLAEAIPVLQQQKGELDVVLLDATLQYLNRKVVETLQAASGCGLIALAPTDEAPNIIFIAANSDSAWINTPFTSGMRLAI